MDEGGPGDRYDLWLSRLVRTFAAFIGLATFAYETVRGKSAEFAILGAGIAGLGFAQAIQRFIEWVTTLRPPPRE